MTIEIRNAELESLLQERLRTGNFANVEDMLLHVLKAGSEGAVSASTGEKAREFEAWVNSFPDTPPLSDEAISRESLYPDRW
jgi:hypothetical protein